MDFFKNKYRISSARATWWDYRWSAANFVTICSKNRELFFGNIIDKKMHVSEIGLLAQAYWESIPDHFNFVRLGEFVVMPNHIHGIVIIEQDQPPREDEKNLNFMSSISPKKGSLSTIIRSYKSVVTKNAKKIELDFAWQPRFHDHIIRDAESYDRIGFYIKNNPGNWDNDKFGEN